MTIAQCYKATFDSAMKERGFQKKGMLYYRMKGDFLQGVYLRPINPYEIVFASFPYWTYYIANLESRGDFTSEEFWDYVGANINGEYHYAFNPEILQGSMKKAFSFLCDTVFPMWDKMDTLGDYLNYLLVMERLSWKRRREYVLSNCSSTETEYYFAENSSEHALILKATLDGDFAATEHFLNELWLLEEDIERLRTEKRIQKISATTEEDILRMVNIRTCYGRYGKYDEAEFQRVYQIVKKEMKPEVLPRVEDELEKKRQFFREKFLRYYSFRESNDTKSFLPIYEAECEKVKKTLMQQLKLSME